MDGSSTVRRIGPTLRTAATLKRSLDALSRLSLSGQAFDSLLVRIAEMALDAVPGAEGAALAVIEPDRDHDVVVSTDPFVDAVDQAQYTLGQGPCVDACAALEIVSSGSFSTDRRWPELGPQISELGVESVLCLPLATDVLLGSINVYARRPDAFDALSVEIASSFAPPAAVALQNVQVLEQARRLAVELEEALHDSVLLDQAIGITMYRDRVDATEAMKRLRTDAAAKGISIVAAVERVVDEAVRRAHPSA